MPTLMIMEPDWHDGELSSISLTAPRTLVLRGTLVNGHAVQITVTGLRILHAEAFLEQNIVDDVAVVSGPDLPSWLVDRLSAGSRTATRRVQEILQDPSTQALILNSILGCSLVALYSGDFIIREE